MEKEIKLQKEHSFKIISIYASEETVKNEIHDLLLKIIKDDIMTDNCFFGVPEEYKERIALKIAGKYDTDISLREHTTYKFTTYKDSDLGYVYGCTFTPNCEKFIIDIDDDSKRPRSLLFVKRN